MLQKHFIESGKKPLDADPKEVSAFSAVCDIIKSRGLRQRCAGDLDVLEFACMGQPDS